MDENEMTAAAAVKKGDKRMDDGSCRLASSSHLAPTASLLFRKLCMCENGVAGEDQLDSLKSGVAAAESPQADAPHL